ncbi:MAG: hypothetical protein KR126chlam1_00320 [Chlamydiae bacterium]|nr:hypothetical protein [Chlamydiota bacterium]
MATSALSDLASIPRPRPNAPMTRPAVIEAKSYASFRALSPPKEDVCTICLESGQENPDGWVAHHADNGKHHVYHEICLKELISSRLEEILAWENEYMHYQPKPEHPACPICRKEIDIFSLLPTKLLSDFFLWTGSKTPSSDNPVFLNRVVTHLNKEIAKVKIIDRVNDEFHVRGLSEAFKRSIGKGATPSRVPFLKESALNTLRAVVSFAEAFFSLFTVFTSWGREHFRTNFVSCGVSCWSTWIAAVACFSIKLGRDLHRKQMNGLKSMLSTDQKLIEIREVVFL